ncbi:alpha-amylase family glycosyl hydrolase [Runella sp.]|uniref:alpha-amylase family glycosyl hydrolase n=1 Tax=Runella sp. TaxID=1960881 RepID=UPI003016498E
MKKYSILLLFILVQISVLWSQKANNKSKGEIIYHVCQRSFYDSNGDMQGDLNGLKEKLDYLQDLGVTSILLLPLYDADLYHNYFANDFEKIDGAFGTMQDYIALVKAIHKRGMKIYMDMETQYVTEKHLWWRDAVGNLQSVYSDYILFEDAAHTIPATIAFDLRALNSYDGSVVKMTTVNLRNQKVLDYNKKLFGFFVDPNGDRKFDDGVDGFRLDHAMDNLDGKPALRNLFADFWKPLLTDLKKINPKLKNVAEQSDWKDYGFSYFQHTGVDRMFGFGLQSAIQSFDKQQLIHKADTILAQCPEGKAQLVFIENHDMDRFASVEKNIEKQKVAAALMLLIGGIPSIYYGQEIGMQGKSASYGNTDGNDISRREAFDWYASATGKGMAIWYKNTGPWWNQTNLKPNDGISLEEQMQDPNSLFNYYKKLIRLKQSKPALAKGQYENAENNNPEVFSFYRIYKNERVLVVVNLSNALQQVTLRQARKRYRQLFGSSQIMDESVALKPYEVIVCEID